MTKDQNKLNFRQEGQNFGNSRKVRPVQSHLLTGLVFRVLLHKGHNLGNVLVALVYTSRLESTQQAGRNTFLQIKKLVLMVAQSARVDNHRWNDSPENNSSKYC